MDEGPKGGVLKEQIVKKLEAPDQLRGRKTESWAYTRTRLACITRFEDREWPVQGMLKSSLVIRVSKVVSLSQLCTH